ncbi:MAG TPA: low molecular weight protein-tyrosine-phosphatase [Acidimicrobiia bacterium]|nr:low molecular weight protein-tyrosine-phosphatase [Acidimicrobiia bacterium]
MTTRILAVCAGNICRSPAAEAAIREAAARRGLSVEVDSAGTGAWYVGSPPHDESVAAGRRFGLAIDGRARRINKTDFDRFDMIVVMDRANLREVTEIAPRLEDRAKIRLFRTFDPGTDSDEVPDPYGGTDEDYDRAISQVMAAAEGLADSLASLSAENGSPS